MLVGLIPGIGAILSLFHLAVLYALYSFEYKWIYQGKQACLKHKHHTVNTHFHLVLRVWLHMPDFFWKQPIKVHHTACTCKSWWQEITLGKKLIYHEVGYFAVQNFLEFGEQILKVLPVCFAFWFKTVIFIDCLDAKNLYNSFQVVKCRAFAKQWLGII